jgi:hypothetical protein
MFKKLQQLFFAIILISVVLPASAQEEEEEDGFTFGGAVRYNIMSTQYESDPTALSTSATWDTWRLNIDGSAAGVDLSFEYRFYPTFGTHFMHHGYLGYEFSDDLYMKLGVFQKPFGITSFASHSWWFQIPYYVGLEDDYDMGIGFDYALGEKGEIQVAYFRQAEPEGPIYGGDVTFGNAGAGRYSYDLTPSGNMSVRELNHFNLRAAYNVTDNIEIGFSGQFGQNYNSVLDESETSSAYAGHLVMNFGNLNFKGEYVNYNYAAKNDDGEVADMVPMGAYGFIYDVANKANMYVAGLAYSIPVDFGPISSIQPYVDFSMVDKANEDFTNTYHLVPGFLISAGGIYTYVDFALGKNQPWLTDNFGVGLGQGRTYSGDEAHQDLYYYTDDADLAGQAVPIEDVPWNLRFNINLGYYF